jgi:hypothetical protein
MSQLKQLKARRAEPAMNKACKSRRRLGLRSGTWPLRRHKRMGPPPRSLALDAHYCIMVRVSSYKYASTIARAGQAPLGIDISEDSAIAAPFCHHCSGPEARTLSYEMIEKFLDKELPTQVPL